MKIFISWSGEVSHRVARALDGWIPCVIQGIETFMSSDISKGDRWNDVLADELKEAQYGIICVTPYNIHKSWMNFEAGALSKAMTRSCVMPFLFHLRPDDINGPLSQFQSTVYEKEDMRSMMHSLNGRIQSPLPNELLDHTFDKWWGDLKDELDGIAISSRSETRGYYDWLYTSEDLDIYSTAMEYSSAWIISNEAQRYLQQNMKDQVKTACKHGKKFKYFLPRTDEYEYHAELEKMVQAYPENIAFKLFPTDEFESQAATDYIVLNPDGEGDLRVLIKIPLGGHPDQEYWFKTNDRSARSLVSRFRGLWEERRTAMAGASA